MSNLISENQSEKTGQSEKASFFARARVAVKAWASGVRNRQKEKLRAVRHRLKNRSKGERVIVAIVFLLFLLYTVSMLYPFIWMLITSFKPFTEFTADM